MRPASWVWRALLAVFVALPRSWCRPGHRRSMRWPFALPEKKHASVQRYNVTGRWVTRAACHNIVNRTVAVWDVANSARRYHTVAFLDSHSWVAVIWLTYGTALSAERPQVERFPSRSNAVIQPVVTRRQKPNYSREASITQLAGDVILNVVVGEDGTAHEIQIQRSLGLGLDENAIEAVRHWSFLPGRRDGKPATISTTIEVRFRCRSDQPFWHLAHVAFDLEGASRPVIVESDYPLDGPADNAVISVRFNVGQDGLPTHVRALASTDPEFEKSVVGTLKGWRFRPAVRNGQSVPVACTLDLVWSTGLPSARMPKTLAEAAIHDQIDALVALLGDGANVNSIGQDGYSPLHRASLKGNHAGVKLLLEHGADPNIRSRDGRLPLHDAAVSGDARTIRALIGSGANVSAVTTEGKETALHLAAAWGRVEVIRELLAAGAATTDRNSKGKTPLDEALDNDHQAAASLLRSKVQ